MSRIISTRNQKAKLAADYNELLKELSSHEMTSIGYYQIGETIGEGSFGKVKLGTHKLTGQHVAIKRIHKKHAPMIAREIHHHRRLRHPSIVTLYEIIITESFIHVISEYCPGGELFDALASCGRCPESRARKWFRQLISAIKYCHTHGIVHRDLKLENILLDARDNAKLCDFGFARQADHRQLLETFCGSLAYSAPEVIERQNYSGPETDIWSLGVVLYTLLAGELPFDDDSEIITQKKIVRVAYEMPSYFPPDAADLIGQMLQKNPSDRLTLDQIVTHPWFQRLDHEDDIVLDNYPGNWTSRSSSFTRSSSHSDNDSLFSVGRGRPHDDDDTCTELSSYDSYSSDHRPLTPKADRLMFQSETCRFSPQVRNSLGINTRPPRSARFSAPTASKSPLLPPLSMSSQRSSLPNSLPSHGSPAEYCYWYDDQLMSVKEQQLAAALTAAGIEQATVKEMRTSGACDALNGLWNMLLEKSNSSSNKVPFELELPMQSQQWMSTDIPVQHSSTMVHTKDTWTQTNSRSQHMIHAITQTVVSGALSSELPGIAHQMSSNSSMNSIQSLAGPSDKHQQHGWLASAVKSWFTNKSTSDLKRTLPGQQQRHMSKSFRNIDGRLPHKEGRRYWDDDATTKMEHEEQQHEVYRNPDQKYRLHSLQLAEPPVAQMDQIAYNTTELGPTREIAKRPQQSFCRYSLGKTTSQESSLIAPPMARTLTKPAPLVDVEKRYSNTRYHSVAAVDIVSVPPIAASSGTTVQHNENKQTQLSPSASPPELQPASPSLSTSSPSSITCSSSEEDGEEEYYRENATSLPVLSLPPSKPSFPRETKLATAPVMAVHQKRSEFMPRSRLNVYGMNSNTSVRSFASKAIIEEEEEEEQY